jgi:vacuolar-type H+-ATPase subunit I/STV1
MKKFLLFLSALFLAACTNSTYEKAMEQGELAIANGEFDKALGLFELATNEEPKEQEAKKQYGYLVAFFHVQEAFDKQQWDKVITKANNLLINESLASNMKKELKQKVETAEVNKAVVEKVTNIKDLIKNKKYTDAQKEINQLKLDVKSQEALSFYFSEVTQVEATLNEEINKQEEAAEKAETEKAAKEKAKAEEVAKKNAIVWDTYNNARYAFSIKYPEGWLGGPEATNGDGRALYRKDNTEVLAYGTMYFEEFKPDLSNYKKISTNQGYVAYYHEENGQFSGYIPNIEEGTEFHLKATMDQNFLKKYSKVILEMLKSVELMF